MTVFVFANFMTGKFAKNHVEVCDCLALNVTICQFLAIDSPQIVGLLAVLLVNEEFYCILITKTGTVGVFTRSGLT